MARRGYKEWAKHLRPKGKRAAAKQARKRDKQTVVEQAQERLRTAAVAWTNASGCEPVDQHDSGFKPFDNALMAAALGYAQARVEHDAAKLRHRAANRAMGLYVPGD